MSIILKYNSAHKSISKRFDPIELPDFCVLTGLNGSGKTHFLEAIKAQKIITTSIPAWSIAFIPIDAKSRKFPVLETLQPEKISSDLTERYALDDDQIKGFRDSIIDLTHLHFGDNLNEIMQRLEANRYCPEYIDNEQIEDAIKKSLISDSEYISLIKYRNAAQALLSNPSKTLSPEAAALLQLITTAAKHVNKSVTRITKYDIATIIMPSNPLNCDILQIFKYYAREWVDNRYHKLARTVSESPPHTFLSEDEFKQKFGTPPWDTINNLLAKFPNFPYRLRVNLPPIPRNQWEEIGGIGIEIVSRETALSLPSTDLSTGEAVILNVAISIYKCVYCRTGTPYTPHIPLLVLLDEPDAFLHPSMISTFLDRIQDGLIKQLHAKVIMVSHSPATIAMVPEQSLFWMLKTDGYPQKRSRQEILDSLCKGFVRIDQPSIVVLVESENDAKFYQMTFEALTVRGELSGTPHLLFKSPRDGGQPANGKPMLRKLSKMFKSLYSDGYRLTGTAIGGVVRRLV